MHAQPTTSTTRVPTPSPADAEPAGGAVPRHFKKDAPAALTDSRTKRWLWVRCTNEPGPLSSELVATVHTFGRQEDQIARGSDGQIALRSAYPVPDAAVDARGCRETQVWCSYHTPEEVYQLIAELVRSGVVIHEVRELSSDLQPLLVGDAVC